MFDFAPLELAVRRRRPEIDNDVALADYLGISPRSLRRYRVGGVSLYTADQLSVTALNENPERIWPGWASTPTQGRAA